MTSLKTAIGVGALLVSGAASAAVVGGAVTGGTAPQTFSIIAAPAQVGNDRQDDGIVYAWDESQNVLLAAPLTIDLPAGVLAAGTRVSSHGVVFDPGRSRSTEGYIDFSNTIIGVITERGTLLASDFLNLVTAFDNVSARGLEAGDFNNTSISGNRLYFDWTASSPGDNIRVLTMVPEPATWAMLIAGFGLVGFAARRRNRGTYARA